MKLVLERGYHPKGTNGILTISNTLRIFTIELPWKENQHGISCIPEGVYNLRRRFTERLGRHFLVEGVPGRDLILIHAANNAEAELKGCIAPVLTLTGEGCGDHSKVALQILLDAVSKVSEKTLFLNIKKQKL